MRFKDFYTQLLLPLDVLALSLAFYLGYVSRQTLPFFPPPDRVPDFSLYLPTMALHVVVIVFIAYLSRLYHPRRTFSRIDLVRQIGGTVTVGAVLAFGSQELLFRDSIFGVGYPRSMFFYIWMYSIALVVVLRELHRVLLWRIRKAGRARDNLILVGTGRIARDIMAKIQAQPELGYNVVGVVNSSPHAQKMDAPLLGVYADLPRLIDAHEVEQVIIALPDARRAEITELVTLCQRGRVDIKVYPDLFSYMAGDLNVDDLGGTPLVTVRDIALRGWKLSAKRALDLFGASVGLVLLSPLLLLTALLIRLESPGPVFYSQERMGLDGRPFPMIKFRSMRSDAETQGPGWTVENDPRVTRVGKVMRKTNWDEIPQLVNVLLGQMSLVGPRPERPVYVQEFRETIPRYMERHREKAGMTGWAQVNGLRGDTSIPARTAHDLWYVENWSMWLDIKIILRTVWQTITRSSPNAY